MNEYSFDFKPVSKDSEIVAHIVAGAHKGKSIYLNNQRATEIENDKMDLLYDYLMGEKYRLTQKKIDILWNAVKNEREPTDYSLQTIYHDFMKQLKQSNEISLPDSEIQIVPYQGSAENVQRDVIFISACSGAGKTTWISNYCKMFNKLFPKSPIYLFSSKPIKDEASFDKVKRIRQISIDEDNLQYVIDKGNYLYFSDKSGQSLVLFDDYDAIPKKQMELLDTILNSILQTGRSSRIYCIVSKHILNAGIKTKIVWSESNKIVLFPNGLSRYSLVYAMKHYIGLDMKMIEKILNLRSRWVCIHNHLPKYYISQNSLCFLK